MLVLFEAWLADIYPNRKHYKPPCLLVYMSKGNRAQTIPHVEYEVLKEVLNNIPLEDLYDAMVADEASERRFKSGAANVAKLIRNLMVRRQHRLPYDHADYKQKED